MEESKEKRGGVRPGAGRPTKANEDKVVQIATNAIIAKYGSIEAGFEALLTSKEPALMRFVFEHAFGKPKDNITLSGEVKGFTLNVKPYK